jgi:AcrR family transcriptional regulator
MRTPFSRSQQRESKRQTIISEASRLFNYQGATRTTLGDIAQALGLTKTSLYYYARNKDELVYMCYLAACDAGDDILSEAADKSDSGLDCLLNFLRVFFNRWDEIQAGKRPHSAMLVEIPTLKAEHRREVEDRVAAHFDTFLDFVRRGIEDRSITPCEPIPTVQAFRALVNWSYVWFGQVPVDEREEVVEQLIDLVKNGISSVNYHFHDMEFPEGEELLLSGFNREQQNQLKRNAFMRMGATMFNERGYGGASLDELARELDVTKGAFYYHIQSKEDLLYQCFRHMLELETETVEDVSGSGRNGAEKIEYVLRRLIHIQHGEDGPLIGYRSLLSLSEDRRREILRETRRLADALGAFIGQGIADKSLRQVNPQVIEHAIAGTVDAAHGLVRHMRVDDTSRVSAHYLQLFFNGIAGRK